MNRKRIGSLISVNRSDTTQQIANYRYGSNYGPDSDIKAIVKSMHVYAVVEFTEPDDIEEEFGEDTCRILGVYYTKEHADLHTEKMMEKDIYGICTYHVLKFPVRGIKEIEMYEKE